jgi:hypothetical protein
MGFSEANFKKTKKYYRIRNKKKKAVSWYLGSIFFILILVCARPQKIVTPQKKKKLRAFILIVGVRLWIMKNCERNCGSVSKMFTRAVWILVEYLFILFC